MTGVVVDTDVVSYLFKRDTRAALYAKHLAGRQLHVSFATVAELYRWAVFNGWGQPRIDALRAALGKYAVSVDDDAMAWEWAHVMSIKGHPMAAGDGWIAATALRHGMALVTHNRKHFETVPGLTVISEG